MSRICCFVCSYCKSCTIYQTNVSYKKPARRLAQPEQSPLDVRRDAAKRLLRVVVKRHPKLEKKLLPDHEGSVSE
ncbi:hypothetical protein GNP93_19990 [Paenibacillus validus]|uniref:Uncharacterized protein n=1 Tax=Paenibacillus validus TaxID=44253 RepID=A0A7X2ZDH8_9BACL|nr:hypothetical protein [Paenibacillus validus]